MTITITRDRSRKMKHTATVRQHTIALDEPAGNGGEDLGVTPHDLYDSALGACKALTVLWYAQRKQIPVEDIQVSVEREDADERKGVYRLRTTLSLGGALSDAQRQELLTVAGKCPVHKLMTQATTEVITELAPLPGP
jgi:putative redox protein